MPTLKKIEQRLVGMDAIPELDSQGYQAWAECQDVVPFLQSLNEGDIPVLISTLYAFVYAMFVPRDLLVDNYRDDLQLWNFSPSDGWVFWVPGRLGDEPVRGRVDQPVSSTGSTILDAGEPAVYLRHFPARSPSFYPDPNQKLIHVAKAHWMQDRGTHSRLDEHGDLVDVVKTRYVLNGVVCTIEDQSLDRFMLGMDYALVHVFDFGRTRHRGGSRFYSPDQMEEVRHVEKGELEASLELLRTAQRVEEGHIRGVNIVREMLCRPHLPELVGKNLKPRVPFIIHDWKHGVVRTYPGERVTPEGTPIEEDWPDLISPAFFRPDVLDRYKANPDKYTMTDETIRCRGNWFLRSYDVNDAGQIHVYLKDLWVT